MKGIASVSAMAEKSEIIFVEIPCSVSTEANTNIVSNKPVSTIRIAALQIDTFNEISDTFLSRIIREVSHAWKSYISKGWYRILMTYVGRGNDEACRRGDSHLWQISVYYS